MTQYAKSFYKQLLLQPNLICLLTAMKVFLSNQVVACSAINMNFATGAVYNYSDFVTSDDIPLDEDYFEVILLISRIYIGIILWIHKFICLSHRLWILKFLMAQLTGECQILPAGFILFILPSVWQRWLWAGFVISYVTDNFPTPWSQSVIILSFYWKFNNITWSADCYFAINMNFVFIYL